MSTTEILDIESTEEARDLAKLFADEEGAELEELSADDLRDFRPSDPIPYGASERESRKEDARLIFEAQIKFDNPDLPRAEIARRAKKRLEEFLKMDPEVKKQFDLLSPTILSPNRNDRYQYAEVAAMRQLPEMQRFERVLRDVRDTGESKNAFNVAMIEHAMFKKAVPDLSQAFDDINGGGELVKWALGDPCGARHPSRPSAAGKTIHKLLARNNPELTIELNLSAIQRLAKTNPEWRIGRYAAVDATAIEANVQQKQTYSTSQRKKVNKKTNALYMRHDDAKKWRGYNLLTLTCMKSNLPLAWVLIPGKPSPDDVHHLLDLLFAYWPDCPLKYIAGDSEFDYSEYYKRLYCWFSIHGAFVTRKGNSSEHDAYFENGVPKHCEDHTGVNHDGLMAPRVRGAFEGWWTPKKRAEFVLPDGSVSIPRGEYIPYENERIRWECTCASCAGKPETEEQAAAREAKGKEKPNASMVTYPHQPRMTQAVNPRPRVNENNPRRFAFLPHAGNSKNAALRRALLLRRNSVEGTFSVLKRKQTGLGGCAKSRWINTDREMEWVLGGTLMGTTFSRMVHVDGSFYEKLEEAKNHPTKLYSVVATAALVRPDLTRLVAA